MSNFYDRYRELFEDDKSYTKPLPQYSIPHSPIYQPPKYEVSLEKNLFNFDPMLKCYEANKPIPMQSKVYSANYSPLKVEALNSLLDSYQSPKPIPTLPTSMKEETDFRKRALRNVYKNSLMYQLPITHEEPKHKKPEQPIITKHKSEYAFSKVPEPVYKEVDNILSSNLENKGKENAEYKFMGKYREAKKRREKAKKLLGVLVNVK